MTPLPVRCNIVDHSPTGFAWGYAGSGPAQLALAILADYFGCADAARALHQLFKFAAISGIHEKHWSITGTDIAAVFEKLCRDRPWLDRLAVFEDGPIVQIVDKYAERPGKFGPSFGDPPARRIRDEPRACADSGGQQRDDALPRSGKRGAATRESRGAIARPRQEIHDYLRVCVHGRKRCGNETRHDCSERCAAVGYARQLRGVASDHEMPT